LVHCADCEVAAGKQSFAKNHLRRAAANRFDSDQ
jgi:hypothetical protein